MQTNRPARFPVYMWHGTSSNAQQTEYGSQSKAQCIPVLTWCAFKKPYAPLCTPLHPSVLRTIISRLQYPILIRDTYPWKVITSNMSLNVKTSNAMLHLHFAESISSATREGATPNSYNKEFFSRLSVSTAARRAPLAAAAFNISLWQDDKRSLMVRFINGGPWEREYVKAVVTEHYNAIPMRIMFEFLDDNTPHHSDIRVEFATFSASLIGRDAEVCQPQEPTMWLKVSSTGRNSKLLCNAMQADILHEFGHALGMEHEHQHPMCPISWDFETLKTRTKWDLSGVQANYDRLRPQNMSFTTYDSKSIMHYPIRPGETNNKHQYLPLNCVLSEEDKRFLLAKYARVSHT